MPGKLVCCVSLPPTTIFSVSVYDGAIANEKLAEVRLLIFAGKAFVKDVLTPVLNLEMMRKCPVSALQFGLRQFRGKCRLKFEV